MENYLTELKENGFCIIKAGWVTDFKIQIKDNLLQIAKFIAQKTNHQIYEDLKYIEDLTDFLSACYHKESDNEITSRCYELFAAQSHIVSLINHPNILNTAKNSGISKPYPGTLPLVRIDRPNNDLYLTPPHQDYWFSMLCDNSIVIWYSLDDIKSDMGLLKVAPGSHKNGIIPFKIYEGGHEPYVPIERFAEHQFIEVSTKKDEVLVFNQMLLHKSGVNRSDKVRLSMQLRFNDLETANTLTTSFVPNHSTHVQNAQNAILNSHKKAS